MALASAGKVPDRGRKFIIFGLFFVIFSLNLGRDPTKITASEPWFWHQPTPASGGDFTSWWR